MKMHTVVDTWFSVYGLVPFLLWECFQLVWCLLVQYVCLYMLAGTCTHVFISDLVISFVSARIQSLYLLTYVLNLTSVCVCVCCGRWVGGWSQSCHAYQFLVVIFGHEYLSVASVTFTVPTYTPVCCPWRGQIHTIIIKAKQVKGAWCARRLPHSRINI